MHSNTTLLFSEFSAQLCSLVSEKLGDTYSVREVTNLKNNHVEYHGLLIRKEKDSIAPTIYIDQQYREYQNGKDLEETANEIISFYHTSMKSEEVADLGTISFQPETMKDCITVRLINYEKNKTILELVPHIRFLDLAIVFHLVLYQQSSGIGSVRFTNEHFDAFRRKPDIFPYQTPEELFPLALANTERMFPHRFNDIIETLQSLSKTSQYPLSEDYSTDDCNNRLYVLTNDVGINGAACILYPGLLSLISSLTSPDFYIIPSSIHEILILKAEPNDSRENLNAMIREVNLTQVNEEEILSNHVYHCDEFLQTLESLYEGTNKVI